MKPQNVTRAAFEQAMGFTLEEVEPAFHKWILSLDADGAYGGKLNTQRRS